MRFSKKCLQLFEHPPAPEVTKAESLKIRTISDSSKAKAMDQLHI
nr:MAG TPA: hypothetical protein [Caudoviricetes sp.]